MSSLAAAVGLSAPSFIVACVVTGLVLYSVLSRLLRPKTQVPSASLFDYFYIFFGLKNFLVHVLNKYKVACRLYIPKVGMTTIVFGDEGSRFYHRTPQLSFLKGYDRVMGPFQPKNLRPDISPMIGRGLAGSGRFEYFLSVIEKENAKSFDAFVKANGPQGKVDVFNWVQDLVLNMVIRMFISEPDGPRFERLKYLFIKTDPLITIGQDPRSFYAPAALAREVQGFYDEIEALITEIAKECLANKCQKNDYMNWLVKEMTNDEGQTDFGAIWVTINSMITAATSTTSVAAAWAVYVAASHKPARESLLAEFKEHITPEKGGHTVENFATCDYADRMIREILRLKIPGISFRLATDNVQFQQYIIPRDELIVFSHYLLQHDEKLYPNADDFDPSRHELPTGGGLDPTKTKECQLVVWGAGRHPCLGTRLAIMEIKSLLAMLFERFDVRFDEQAISDLNCVVGLAHPVKTMYMVYREKPQGSWGLSAPHPDYAKYFAKVT